VKRALLIVAGILLGLVGAQAVLVLTASPMLPIELSLLALDAAAVPTDGHLALARQHAPWLMLETDAILGRQDIPSAMDFDGDMDATDNWEDMPRFELVPTVYYMLVETETHWFLTYHVYHPRAWSRIPLGIGDTHEGDGESVQVVVSKATQEPVILTTQAQDQAWSYATTQGPVRNGKETLRGDFEVSTGHPVVYVRSGRHGMYGSHDPRAANRLAHAGDPVVAYRPTIEGETPREPRAPWNETATYRLVSLPLFLANSTEHPTLFTSYEAGVPRYHKGDRYSGPLGASRGTSPFALAWNGADPAFDALFWRPAEGYQGAFLIEGDWSDVYVEQPFKNG
jgi:hypothetical protein